MLSRIVRRALPRLPNYMKAFGIFPGIALNWKVEMFSPSGSYEVREYDVPWLGHRVFLRDCVGDKSAYWQCMVQRQYDLSEFPHHLIGLRRKYDEMVKKGVSPLIIDGGANIGLASVGFHHEFPIARIVAVEPDAGNFSMLTKNCERFAKRVSFVNGGLWHRNAFLKIVNPEAGDTAFVVKEVEGENVEGTVLGYGVGQLIEAEGCKEALIVKLDIEGAQRFLFGGNTEWIDVADCVILEFDDWLFPWEGTTVKFISAMADRSFDFLLHGEHMVCFNHGLMQYV